MSEQGFCTRLKWLGCACFEMNFGSVTVVNDPWITQNPKTNLTWEAVEKCDYITLSHGHFDHVMDIPALLRKFDPYVLCGENTAIPLMQWSNINPMKVYPMYPNLEVDLDDVRVQALYGHHTPLPGGWNDRAHKHQERHSDADLIALGQCGDFEYRNYLFTVPDGTKVLVWGNPLHQPIQRNIFRKIKPDIVVMQLSSNYSAENTAKAIKETGCKVVIPHHTDFPNDKTPLVNALGEELAKYAPEIRYIVPEYGKWIEL